MKVNTVKTYDKNHVVIYNMESDAYIHITRILNRVIVFTKADHRLAVMFVSRDYGTDEEALYEKFLHVIAKMSMKAMDSKYFLRAEALHYNNGPGVLGLSSTDRSMINDHAWKLLEESDDKQE